VKFSQNPKTSEKTVQTASCATRGGSPCLAFGSGVAERSGPHRSATPTPFDNQFEIVICDAPVSRIRSDGTNGVSGW
jgi:hypothetical protein